MNGYDLHLLRRFFLHDAWANRETLAALERAGAALPPQALRWFAHLLAAERLWLWRLRGDRSPVAVWPESTLEQCGTESEEMARLYPAYLETLTPEALEAPVSYVNSKGEAWASRVEDILLHVTQHSTYHRGQIASALREAGATPPYTDFIHAARQGLLD
jgi:uncharacterized damage-inducible protein DinB